MKLERLLTVLQALASETRLRIVLELLEDPKCHVDLSRCVGRDVSTVWRHVEVLEKAGIVVTRRVGRKVIADIKEKEKLREALRLLSSL